MSSLLALTGAAEGAGFRRDSRFAPAAPAEALPAPHRESEPPEDPLALAFAEGFALGQEQARAELGAAATANDAAREALSLAFGKLDAELAESLRQRLTDTVLALCEQTLVPYAHDPAILAERVSRALALFARADDERVIRLHPDDLALVSDRLESEWKVVPDPALRRGALRIETQAGGVEDGPAEWRRALAEAFHSC